MDYKTGEITVKQCSSPGAHPCIDYERFSEYQLVVIGKDKCGEDLEATTTVVVKVGDRDDGGGSNEPLFTLASYRGTIRAGEYDPGITVQVGEANTRNGVVANNAVPRVSTQHYCFIIGDCGISCRYYPAYCACDFKSFKQHFFSR